MDSHIFCYTMHITYPVWCHLTVSMYTFLSIAVTKVLHLIHPASYTLYVSCFTIELDWHEQYTQLMWTMYTALKIALPALLFLLLKTPLVLVNGIQIQIPRRQPLRSRLFGVWGSQLAFVTRARLVLLLFFFAMAMWLMLGLLCMLLETLLVLGNSWLIKGQRFAIC